MKRFLFYVFIAFIASSCNEADETPLNTSLSSDNLFLWTDYKTVDKNLDSTVLGLWRSQTFEIDNVYYEILWEVTEEDSRLALKCQWLNQTAHYVQVRADYDEDLVRSFDRFTVFDFILSDDTRLIDTKNLLPPVSLGAHRFPVPDEDQDHGDSSSSRNRSGFGDWTSVEEQAQQAFDNEGFYQDPLCFIAMEGAQVAEKGLLASGMDEWEMAPDEDTSDGLIELEILGVESPVILRKIQNR